MAPSNFARHLGRAWQLALVASLATLCLPRVAQAQRPDSVRRADSLRVDSLRAAGDSLPTFQRLGAPEVGAKPPLSARRAFLYSFLVPGLGQARLDRPNGGAL